jgi:hypothetical protein
MLSRSSCIAALSVITMTTVSAAAFAYNPAARPATKSERSAIMKAFTEGDGSSAEVHGVYVSRSNSSLAVVCVHTPEAGIQAFVFGRVRRTWRYVTSGAVGHAGNSADRRLEHACG